MSHRTYDRTWKEAMEELVELTYREDLIDPKIQKSLHGWSVIYLRYLRACQRLNMASNHIIQAQKRKDLRRCLECCTARMLEIRAHLVTLNKGMDVMSLEPAMTELGLTPEALDIPVPGYLLHRPSQADLQGSPEAPDDFAKENLFANGAVIGGSEPLTDAIAKAMTQVAGSQRAATRIQTAARGLLDRMHAARAAEQELLFLNMKRQRPAVGARKDQGERAMADRERLATAQREADAAYQAALVTEKAEVALLEGPGMREEIQGKINDWLLRARDANPGHLPELPSTSEGGSRSILQEAPAAAQSVTPPAAAKGTAKLSGKAAQPPAKRGKDVGSAAAVMDGMPRLTSPDLLDAVTRWQEVWENRPEPELGAWEAVQLDKQLLKAEVRPGVFEDIRMQADKETRLLLTNLKELADAEAAAIGKPKAAKKDAGGSKAKPAKHAEAPKELKPASQKPADAKRKDLTAERSLASLREELEEQGLLVETPEVELDAFMAACSYAQRGQKPGDIDSEPSLLAIRSRMVELCVLPLLLNPLVRTRVPMTKAILLYGAPCSGKTMLAHAMAYASGARTFNISPRNVEGRYSGKAVSLMMHMVFKVAREMGSSVIYLDEAEKVFAMDKRQAEEVGGSEPCSRIKRDLLQEIQALQPADRVVVIGCTSEPFSCTKKDSESLLAAFDKHFYVPLPDYATRQAMWTAAVEAGPCQVEDKFDLASVCLLSEGQSAASILQIMQSSAARRHGTKQALTADDVKDELAQHPAAAALQCVEQLLEWRKSTPMYRSILEGDEDSEAQQAKAASTRKRT